MLKNHHADTYEASPAYQGRTLRKRPIDTIDVDEMVDEFVKGVVAKHSENIDFSANYMQDIPFPR